MNLLKRIWYWRQRKWLYEALARGIKKNDQEYCEAIVIELERLGGV